MVYSYKMLMVPASKVSVPLTVVMRTRSRVPDSVLFPPDKLLAPFAGVFVVLLTLPEDTHALVEILVKTTEPDIAEAATRFPAPKRNPAVDPALMSLKVLAPER